MTTKLLAVSEPQPQILISQNKAIQIAAVGIGTVALATSSYIVVPMVPVPMTMQTFAVTMIAALYGWRLGTLTVLAWLLEAAIGFPVLAGGAAGIGPFLGPTGGYILAFPLMSMVVGYLAQQGCDGRVPVLTTASMLLGNFLCLAIGAAWLSSFTGWAKAIELGVSPFILGAVLKSVLGAALLTALAMKRSSAK